MSDLLSRILKIDELCIVAFTFGWKRVKIDYFCQKSCIVAYNSTKSYIGDSKSYIIFIKKRELVGFAWKWGSKRSNLMGRNSLKYVLFVSHYLPDLSTSRIDYRNDWLIVKRMSSRMSDWSSQG